MKSVGMLLSLFLCVLGYEIFLFFPRRICLVPKYPLASLPSVAELLQRLIPLATRLLEYFHKEHLLALIICSLNRISFLPKCGRSFLPDCEKILFLKLEKSESTNCEALFKNNLQHVRYSIPYLAFQFLNFFLTRYDTRGIISNFSFVHFYTLFVLSIDSIFNTDVF